MLRLVVALLSSLGGLACSQPGPSSDPAAPPNHASPPTSGQAEPIPERPRVDMPSATEVGPAAAANNALAFDLYGRLRTAPGNLAMSPASISIALAMTWGGAKGETEAQMRRVLHFEGGADAVLPTLGTLSGALQSPDRKLKLRIANRLFGEQSFTFEAPFVERTRALFGAPLEPTDFKTAPEPARQDINRWVAQQTEDRIRDLLPDRSITSETRIVLVNAIYFLADWAKQFEKERTSDRPFAVTAANKRDVPMMHQLERFRLAKAEGVRMLELPYEGNDAAMWIVLPDRVDGLPAFEDALSVATLDRLRAALVEQDVMVALPRFTIDPPTPIELSQHLSALGMSEAFDDSRADFTGIGVPPDPRMRLYISAVFHKAFVKVDEKGTEAAAATAVVMAEGAGMPPPAEEFIADHPFLFLIVDNASGLLLFMGRVASPA